MSTNKGDEESLSRPQQDDLVPAERRRLERIISNKARLKALQIDSHYDNFKQAAESSKAAQCKAAKKPKATTSYLTLPLRRSRRPAAIVAAQLLSSQPAGTPERKSPGSCDNAYEPDSCGTGLSSASSSGSSRAVRDCSLGSPGVTNKTASLQCLPGGRKKKQQMGPKRSRPLPSLRGAAPPKPPLGGLQPTVGIGLKKLKSSGVRSVADGMDVLAVAAAAANMGSSVVAEEPAAVKDSIDAARAAAANKDSLPAAVGPTGDAGIDDLSLTIGPIPAAASGWDFSTPGAALTFPRVDSSEGQQTLSTTGSRAAAAEHLRAQNKEMELESMRLERARLEYETEVLRRDMRQSNAGNSERPSKGKRSKAALAAPLIDLTDHPLAHNKFAREKRVEKAISDLISDFVYNLGKDPDITMFPDSDDQRDRLWQHIQEDSKLCYLVDGDAKDIEAAFQEYWTEKGAEMSKLRYTQRTQGARSLLCEGYLLANGRGISTKLAKEESPDEAEADLAWWRSVGTWGDGSGYRKGRTALDGKAFLVALASAFCKSALAHPTRGYQDSLKTDPVRGLVIVTFEQAAWASFKLQQLWQDKKKGLPDAHLGPIMEEMAKLKKELLDDGVKPVGLKLVTNDPELKALLA